MIAPGLATAAPGDLYVGGGQDVDFQVLGPVGDIIENRSLGREIKL